MGQDGNWIVHGDLKVAQDEVQLALALRDRVPLLTQELVAASTALHNRPDDDDPLAKVLWLKGIRTGVADVDLNDSARLAILNQF